MSRDRWRMAASIVLLLIVVAVGVDEGLLDPVRKRSLPELPRVVGVVTSKTGAALHDIMRVAQERCPVHILVADCRVRRPVHAPNRAPRRAPRLAHSDRWCETGHPRRVPGAGRCATSDGRRVTGDARRALGDG